MAPILSIPRLLAEMGLEPEELIAEADLDPPTVWEPDTLIPYAAMGRLFALCSARSRCPHFGLLVGQEAGLEVLGLAGELARHSPDVGTALRNGILYMHLHDRGAVPALWVDGDQAILGYTIYEPDVPGTQQIYDGAIAIGYNILKALAGPEWEPTELCLYRSRPDNCEPYQRFFRAPLRFGAELNAVVFAASWLDRKLDGADALIHQRIMREIESLEAQGAGDLVAQLRRVLRRMLVASAPQGETRLGQIAYIFALHRRTLNRRLRERGTSFRALIHEARYDIARQLLRDTRLPVREIAAALDYSECAAFVRAFRRCSGTSPRAWRADTAPPELGHAPDRSPFPHSHSAPLPAGAAAIVAKCQWWWRRKRHNRGSS
jgi:AraC-like DNA-binding protein